MLMDFLKTCNYSGALCFQIFGLYCVCLKIIYLTIKNCIHTKVDLKNIFLYTDLACY